ncbi:MAG: hypothetical protein IJ170_10630 [Ruminococcus sp.]|nr:hypothetical protein [Ruminococcus sp.]
MRRITAAVLALALIGAVSCGDGPSESKPSESRRPESSAAEERAVSAKDLALAVKNVHMELSASAPEDPAFGKAVAVGKLEKGDIFGDRLLPALPDSEGGDYILIHRENGSLKQVFVRYPGSEEIGCWGDCKDVSELDVTGWEELAAACEAAGGIPREAVTVTLEGEELCRNTDKAILPKLEFSGDPATEVWLETAEPSLSMVGYMGIGYTVCSSDSITDALLTLTYDPELIFIVDQSPEKFQPAMYIYSESGDIDEVPGQTVDGCSISAKVQVGNTYILANKADLEKYWNS